MLYPSTLSEISNNINTGVEYEIALFFKLLESKKSEQTQVLNSISKRKDESKIKSIIAQTDISPIETSLKKIGCKLVDVSFETQNDEVGPADIVMLVKNTQGQEKQIGLSVILQYLHIERDRTQFYHRRTNKIFAKPTTNLYKQVF